MKILQKLKSANRIRREEGLAGIRNKIKSLRRSAHEKRAYQEWIKAHALTDTKRAEIRAAIARFSRRPLISVVLPVYNVEEKWLRKCLDSVFRQLYENWELCIADDDSPAPHVRRVLEEYAARDGRVKVVFRAANGHISAASNSALELATGEFAVLVDHDDEITEDALFHVARELNDFPDTAMIYSDEDMIDEHGNRYMAKFKPDFSRDFLYSLNLITHLSAYRTAILREIGGFRVGLEGSQDYDLALRFIERIDEKQIRHIPRILYHWRAIKGSVALSSDEKPYAHERARQALRDHFERTGTRAKVERGAYQFHRVRYELPDAPLKVSLILSADESFAGARRAAGLFLKETVYENLEVFLICAGKPKEADLSAGFKVISRADFSNAEVLNRAAAQSTGEVLCFADAHLRPLSKDWLIELTGFALQKEIGAVGGRILARDRTVDDAGLIIGFGGLIAAAHRGFPAASDGYFLRARVVNNFSAVSARCLAVRRELFEQTGGFDAGNLPVSLFDADFCLRLHQNGRRIVFTPYAEFVSAKASKAARKHNAGEKRYFEEKWRAAIARDPFYNPNLSLQGETFTIKI